MMRDLRDSSATSAKSKGLTSPVLCAMLGLGAFLGLGAGIISDRPADAPSTPPSAEVATRYAQLPARLPETNVPIESGFIISFVYHDDIPDLIKTIDKAVAMAILADLRCDSVSAFEPLTSVRGATLVCNRFGYKYAIEDKGRGFHIRIAN